MKLFVYLHIFIRKGNNITINLNKMKTKITNQIINEAIAYLAYEYDTDKEKITVESISDEASIINVIDEQWIVTTKYGERQKGTIQREILSYPNNFALINI